MANAKNIQAGGASVVLSLDDRIAAGLKKAAATLKSFGENATKLGAAIGGAGAVILAPFAAGVKNLVSTGDALGNMSKRTGASVEALSSLSYAANQCDIDIETLETGIKKAQKTIMAAGGGSKEAADALATLGLSFEQLAGLAPDQQFEAILDGLNRIPDPTQKAALAMQLLGKSGTALLPLAGEFRELKERAYELGVVMSREDAEAAGRFDDTLKELWQVVLGGARALGSTVLPTLQRFAEIAIDVGSSVVKWIKAHRELMFTLAVIGAALTGVGAMLTGFGATVIFVASVVKSLATVIPLVVSGVKALGIAMTFLYAHPVVAGLAIVAAAVAAIGTWALFSRDRLADLREAADQLAAGDRRRQGDAARMGRLQELAGKGSLTPQETAEAGRLIEVLKEHYGDLGITIDSTTGKVIAAANAFQQLADAMREVARLELEKKLAAQEEELARLRGQVEPTVQKRTFWDKLLPWGEGEPGAEMKLVDPRRRTAGDKFWPWGEGQPGAEFKDIPQATINKYNELKAGVEDTKDRLAALARGEAGAVTGTTPGTTPVITSEALQKTEREWAEKLHTLKLQQIEDEYDRARALINDKYDLELQRAKEAHQDTPAITSKINENRQQELDNARVERERKLRDARIAMENEVQSAQRSLEAARAAVARQRITDLDARDKQRIEDELQQELAGIDDKWRSEKDAAARAHEDWRQRFLDEQHYRDTQAAQERARLAQMQREENKALRARDLDYNIADAKLRLQKTGYALAMAQLDLEEKRAIEDAKRNGDDISKTKQWFALQREALRRQGSPGTLGIFYNPSAARIAGTGEAFAKATSENTAEMKRLLRDIKQKIEPRFGGA